MPEHETVLPIKILINALKLDEGPTHHLAGNYHHVEQLTKALSIRADLSLTVLCDEYTRKPLEKQLSKAVLRFAELKNGGVLAADAAVVSATKEIQPDLYHRPGGQLPLYRLKCPTVATLADLNFLYVPMPFVRRMYKQVSYRLTVRRATQITCVSRYTRDEVVGRLRADPNRITVVPHGTNCLSQPTYNLASRAGSSYWITFGHQAHKNVETVLQALARRPSQERLVVVGESPSITEVLSPMAKSLGIQDRVDFPGRVPASELHGLLKRAAGLIFLSLYEGFGLPILEAMQAGCPVICSNRCSLPEVAGEAALIQDATDVEAAARSMERLQSEKGLRDQLVGRGFERIRLFTWEAAAEQTVAVYRRALGHR